MSTTRRDNVIRAARAVVALLERTPDGDVYFPSRGNGSTKGALRALYDSVRWEQAATVPTVVCLCGSTRFWRQFQASGLAETMAGRIVLSIGAASGTDDEHFGNLPQAEYDRVKEMLDTLHLRKIDLCDECLILNVDDYIGQSTMRELGYARASGKCVRWLQPSRYAQEGEVIG